MILKALICPSNFSLCPRIFSFRNQRSILVKECLVRTVIATIMFHKNYKNHNEHV